MPEMEWELWRFGKFSLFNFPEITLLAFHYSRLGFEIYWEKYMSLRAEHHPCMLYGKWNEMRDLRKNSWWERVDIQYPRFLSHDFWLQLPTPHPNHQLWSQDCCSLWVNTTFVTATLLTSTYSTNLMLLDNAQLITACISP